MTLDLNAIKARVDKAFASLSKAHPYLVKHADHIDGEFDHALSTVRQEIERLTAEREGNAEVFNDLCRVLGAPSVEVAFEILEADIAEKAATESRLSTLTADHAALAQLVRTWQEARKARYADHSMTPGDVFEETRMRYANASDALAAHPLKEAT